MGMDEVAWERHAHPLSVWTRVVLGAPLMVLAIWSRAWIGWWSLALIICVAFAIWLNPRITPRPLYTDSWAAKGVLGERVFLRRAVTPIPRRHVVVAHLLTIVSAGGAPFLIYGLWRLSVWPTIFGLALVYLGKLWFVDRMVWLYEDMREITPEYQEWLRERPGKSENP